MHIRRRFEFPGCLYRESFTLQVVRISHPAYPTTIVTRLSNSNMPLQQKIQKLGNASSTDICPAPRPTTRDSSLRNSKECRHE